MRKRFVQGLTALVFVGLIETKWSGAQEKEKDKPIPTIYPAALFPFEERGAAVKDFGVKTMDLLFAKLAANPELYLVDRADLKKTLQELELNLSGAVKAGEANKVGQLTGAKLLVTGSVFQVDKKIYLVAKIIGTETSRTAGVSVDGKSNDEFGPLVEKLAGQLSEAIRKNADKLVAKAASTKDRLAALQKALKKGDRPSLLIQVSERHIGAPRIDPAAEIELTRFAKETGFMVLDAEEAARGAADILIKGEGFSETVARNGGLITVRARVEIKATERKTGKVLAVDRQTAVVVDLGEQIGGKKALQEAAAMIAERILPKLVKANE